MRYKVIIISIIIFVLFSFIFISNQPDTEIIHDDTVSKSSNGSVVSTNKVNILDEKVIPKELSGKIEPRENLDVNNDHKTSLFVIGDDKYDEEQVNNFFYEKDNQGVAIKKGTLESVFYDENFNAMITNFRNGDKTRLSLDREQALADKVASLRNSTVFKEDFSCLGDVCALEISYTDMEKEEIDKIKLFSKNYVFNNFTENEHGEKTLRAIYIATDDVSTLRLSTKS